jgi:hypothetical protein
LYAENSSTLRSFSSVYAITAKTTIIGGCFCVLLYRSGFEMQEVTDEKLLEPFKTFIEEYNELKKQQESEEIEEISE